MTGMHIFCPGAPCIESRLPAVEKEKLAAGVEDCEVAQEGIYYTDEDGGLFLEALDGTDRNFLTDTPPESKIVLHGDFVYFWGEEDRVIRQYSILSGSVKEIELQQEMYTTDYIWVSDDYFIYNTSSTEGCKYDLKTGQEESLDRIYGLMDKEKGLFCNDKLYYVIGDTLYCYDVLADERSKINRDEIGEASPSSPGGAEEEHAGTSDTSKGYDIAENIGLHVSEGNAFVASEYFTLYLPADASWDWEVINSETIRFFYPPAKEAGFGGTFVTIKAYDWGDNGYSDIPSYQIAGLDNLKKYIAIFPTDVQYDVSNSVQSAEYQRLLEHARRINNEGADNPFTANNG